MESSTPYTVIVSAADAISGGRPGARRQATADFAKRMKQFEEIAHSFNGIDNAFAIQAGRELRVMVNSGKIDDKQAILVARDIAREIEKELTYPGEIKVTVIRETRIVEYAR